MLIYKDNDGNTLERTSTGLRQNGYYCRIRGWYGGGFHAVNDTQAIKTFKKMIAAEEKDDTKIKVISEAEALRIIKEYEKQQEDPDKEWDPKDLGQFIALQSNCKWVAIDNLDGYAWNKDFDERRDAERWLREG